jgi:hypothetical protein
VVRLRARTDARRDRSWNMVILLCDDEAGMRWRRNNRITMKTSSNLQDVAGFDIVVADCH